LPVIAPDQQQQLVLCLLLLFVSMPGIVLLGCKCRWQAGSFLLPLLLLLLLLLAAAVRGLHVLCRHQWQQHTAQP
jgi:hypothetical protein